MMKPWEHSNTQTKQDTTINLTTKRNDTRTTNVTTKKTKTDQNKQTTQRQRQQGKLPPGSARACRFRFVRQAAQHARLCLAVSATATHLAHGTRELRSRRSVDFAHLPGRSGSSTQYPTQGMPCFMGAARTIHCHGPRQAMASKAAGGGRGKRRRRRRGRKGRSTNMKQ